MDRTYEDVACRAYDLFLSRGSQHGHDVDDWLEAERQLAIATTLSGEGGRTAPRARASGAKPRRRSRT
jgi:Protein of unknown function (DUF2934)